ncbi:MAG: hypothetical protein ACI4M9_04070 [Succinivibrio sp.]
MSNKNNISPVRVDVTTGIIPAGSIREESFNGFSGLNPDRYLFYIHLLKNLNISFFKHLKEHVLSKLKAVESCINTPILYAQACLLKLGAVHIAYAEIMKCKISTSMILCTQKNVKAKISTCLTLRNIFTLASCNTFGLMIF